MDAKSRNVALAAAGAAAVGAAILLWYRSSRRPAAAAAAPHKRAAAKGTIFAVGPHNGYLPSRVPLRRLPPKFAALEKLMEELPFLLGDAARPAALADAVAALPQYDVDDTDDALLLQALMRDYAVLASAYLLEGKTKSGAPRGRLPANVAVPFAAVAAAVGEPSIMSYDSYCLSNVRHVRQEGAAPGAAPNYEDWRWADLRLIRAFDGGPEEATFVLVHSEIEAAWGLRGVAAYDRILDGLARRSAEGVGAGLAALREACQRMVVSQLKMFNASDPRNYESRVRPWIFGWKSNPEFPRGVVFEGVGGGAPTFLRGETGAQSTIIPSLDVVTGITHKEDMLHAMLTELEAYRPKPHREYLTRLRLAFWGKDTGAGGAVDAPEGHAEPYHALRTFIKETGSAALAKTLNDVIGLVWAFRDIHVSFSDMYIARYTDRETATGGTPFKAYLRKHRDESLKHQLHGFGDAALCKWRIPTADEQRDDIEHALSPATRNGIPRHLLERHADIIAKFGGGDVSLAEKAFPTSADISDWVVGGSGASVGARAAA